MGKGKAMGARKARGEKEGRKRATGDGSIIVVTFYPSLFPALFMSPPSPSHAHTRTN